MAGNEEILPTKANAPVRVVAFDDELDYGDL